MDRKESIEERRKGEKVGGDSLFVSSQGLINGLRLLRRLDAQDFHEVFAAARVNGQGLGFPA